MRQNLGQIRTRVQEIVGITNSSFATKIDHWINEVYEDVYDRYIWPGSLIRGTVTTTAAQEHVNLPPRIRAILFMSQIASPIWMRFSDTAQFVREFNDTIATQGTPTNWTHDGESPVLAQPSSASVITFASDSASDVSQTVRVIGRDANGVLLAENVQLNGLTSALTTASFTVIESISKSATTVGIVTGTSNAAAVTVCRIAPSELDGRVIRLRLNLVPDSAMTLYWIGKRHIVRLTDDSDQLFIDMDSAVVAGAAALALREQGDPKEASWAARAGGIIESRINEILGQGMKTLKLQQDRSERPRSNFYGGR